MSIISSIIFIAIESLNLSCVGAGFVRHTNLIFAYFITMEMNEIWLILSFKKKKKNTRRKFSPCSIQFCWLWWIEWWLNRTGNEENHKFSFFILFFDPSVFSDERRKNCETIYLFECKNVDKKNWHLFLAKKKINQSVCIDFSDRFANLADGIVDSGPFEIYETLLNIKH